ncbi:InlB B-repeat-containing protein, partial [Adlercreutzia sp. ZJ141]|uniref:InlB B-repeat-containing protein n=1 Tax=Adlercreutzia sp. ZJ141 TaxID=2709406 RepID=UPI001F1526F2
MFERLIDVRNTFEGKFLAVLLSVSLMFSSTNALAFAEVNDEANEGAATGTEQVAEGSGQGADGSTPAPANNQPTVPETEPVTEVPAEPPTQQLATQPDATQQNERDSAASDNADAQEESVRPGEAKVTFMLQDAYVKVKGQELTGLNEVELTVEGAKELKFSAFANTDCELTEVKAKNSKTNEVPMRSEGNEYTIEAADVDSTLEITVETESDQDSRTTENDVTTLTLETALKNENDHHNDIQGAAIKFDANGGEGAPDPVKLDNGSVTIPDQKPTRAGYEFQGWATSKSESQVSYQNGQTYSDLEAGVTLYAVWKEVEAPSITIIAQGETTIEKQIGTVQLVATTVPADAHVTWSSKIPAIATVDEKGLVKAGDTPGTVQITATSGEETANISITVKAFETITFDSNGGNIEVPPPRKVACDSETVLPGYNGTKTKDGKELLFVGWSEDAQATERGSAHYTSPVFSPSGTYKVEHSTKLYAVWAEQDVGALFFIRLKGDIPNEPQECPTSDYTEGLYKENAISNASFYADSAGVDDRLNTENLPTEEEIQGLLEKAGKTYDPNKQYIVWYVIKNEAEGWHVDGSLLDRTKVTLKYHPNAPTGKFSGVPEGQQYEVNTTATISEKIPKRTDGYVFTGWKDGEKKPYEPGAQIKMNTSKDLYAQWENRNRYTVTYQSAGNGSVDPKQNVDFVTSTKEITGSTATPQAGYKFVGWYKDNVEVSNKATLTKETAVKKLNRDSDELYCDTTFEARFVEDDEVDYTYTTETGGSVSSVSESVKPVTGTAQGSTATAATGYLFDGWYVKDDNNKYVKITKDNQASYGVTVEDTKIIPKKNASGVYTGGNFFAKFERIEVTVTTTGGEYTYDGKSHGATVSVSGLPKDYTVEATSSATATNVTERAVDAKCDHLVIKNTKGEDVTKDLKITYVDGSITVNPATLTVTTPSESKVYDGTALTAKGTITGFVNGETAT